MKPRLLLDTSANAAYLHLASTPRVERTYACDPSAVGGQIHLDFDGDGKLVGVEILEASRMLPSEAILGAEPPSRWLRWVISTVNWVMSPRNKRR